MNYERIASTVDTNRMRESHVTAVGGSNWLLEALARCGLGSVTPVDFDRFTLSNLARQDAYQEDIGQPKVDAEARRLRRVNPDIEVEVVRRDFCELTEEESDELCGHTDLFVFAADAFPPQARGNREAIRLGKPAIWIGLYPQGCAGEIIYYVPGITPACYRCIAVSRYAAFAKGVGRITSDGGTIFDLHLVDAIAGQIALGILTRGAPNRYGRLIEQLGNRNLLQVKIDPTYTLGGRDIFGEYLGSHPANVSFTTIALPMEAEPDCPDCKHLQAAAKGPA